MFWYRLVSIGNLQVQQEENYMMNIAILGLGTVGGGTYDILRDNGELIRKRTGADYKVTRILEINPRSIEAHQVDPSIVTQNADEILNDPDIDIVVEALGGIEPASSMILKALENGKHVVTPNKAAVAANYDKMKKAADASGVQIRIEACVGGGIPCLTAITEALAGNEFTEVLGIVNGTTNYIMTKMGEEGLAYDDVLKDAQAKGFAEADPTADVEGIDCANKLSILMALAFDRYVPPTEIPTTGITGVTMEQINAAKEKNCKIKLIARATVLEDGSLDYEIRPMEIPDTHPLAGVSNEFNAIYVTGNAVGEVMLYGKGAGALPTGSAIVGDIISILRTAK